MGRCAVMRHWPVQIPVPPAMLSLFFSPHEFEGNDEIDDANASFPSRWLHNLDPSYSTYHLTVEGQGRMLSPMTSIFQQHQIATF